MFLRRAQHVMAPSLASAERHRHLGVSGRSCAYVGLRGGALWARVVTAGRTCVDVALVLDDGYPAAWTACVAVHTQAAV